METAFVPLEEVGDKIKDIEGLTPAQISKMQWAIMSPWMLCNRCTEVNSLSLSSLSLSPLSLPSVRYKNDL